jgi:hypothetical protein
VDGRTLLGCKIGAIMNEKTLEAIIALRDKVFVEAASRDEFTQRLASATFHALLGALFRYPPCCITYFVASVLAGKPALVVDKLDRIYCPKCKDAIDGR